MTENEIIQYMKDNRKNGIIFALMPQIIQNWCIQNENKLPFEYFNNNQLWINIKEFKIQFNDIPNGSFSLPEDFELKKESEGEWVEFNIKDGVFYEAEMGVCYKWYEWSCFIAKNISYEVFGGWLYDKSGDWVLSPQVGLKDDSGNAPFILNRYSYSYKKERITPVIPIKIRFWRK